MLPSRVLALSAVVLVPLLLAACGDDSSSATGTPDVTASRQHTASRSPRPTVSFISTPRATIVEETEPVRRGCGPGLFELPDEVIIADRTLNDAAGDAWLLAPEAERDALAAEIGQALASVRAAFPPATEIHAPPLTNPRLGVGLEGELREQVTRVARQENDPPDFRTGNTEFDELNRQLGIVGMRFLTIGETAHVYLCVSDRVNVQHAAERYSAIEGVRYAEENGLGGDGPGLWALKSNGMFFVVVREAGGDCPAGCTEETLHFFTVAGGQVTRVAEQEALGDIRFEVPLARARWQLH